MAEPAPSLWRAVLDPDWTPPDLWRTDPPLAESGRLADLVTPALASYLLDSLSCRLGRTMIDPDEARRSRLLNRYHGEHQRRIVADVAGSGIPVVWMKGFAFAHELYSDPDLRTIGDLDLLVADEDLEGLLTFLGGRGFRFEDVPTPAWGFISDASFLPMVSADGACDIDVHVQPDCYPAYRSLTARQVFAQRRQIDIGDVSIDVPGHAHALVLCLTNAAKDKFGPYSVRKLVDVAMLLRSSAEIDWDEVARLAREGHFTGPARAAFALLLRLGLPPDTVPPAFRSPPRGLAAWAFEGLVRDHAELFARTPGTGSVLARELLLCTQPDVALSNAGRRLRGIFRPRRGLPPGHAVRQ